MHLLINKWALIDQSGLRVNAHTLPTAEKWNEEEYGGQLRQALQ